MLFTFYDIQKIGWRTSKNPWRLKRLSLPITSSVGVISGLTGTSAELLCNFTSPAEAVHGRNYASVWFWNKSQNFDLSFYPHPFLARVLNLMRKPEQGVRAVQIHSSLPLAPLLVLVGPGVHWHPLGGQHWEGTNRHRLGGNKYVREAGGAGLLGKHVQMEENSKSAHPWPCF